MNKKYDIKYYCKCGNQICYTTFKYGKGRCRYCANKGTRNGFFGKHHTKKIKKHLSLQHIGIMIGKLSPLYIDGRSIKKYYCIDCNIPISFIVGFYGKSRCRKCADKQHSLEMSGKNNPNYINGLSYSLYTSDFNESIKKYIRERDNHICQNPDCNKTEKENKQALDVHHIDYNKENCKEENLISLCHNCNVKANYNRDYYFALFNYLISNIIKLGAKNEKEI